MKRQILWLLEPVLRGDQYGKEDAGIGTGESKFKSQLRCLPAAWQDNYVNLEFLISESGIMGWISQNFVRN